MLRLVRNTGPALWEALLPLRPPLSALDAEPRKGPHRKGHGTRQGSRGA